MRVVEVPDTTAISWSGDVAVMERTENFRVDVIVDRGLELQTSEQV